MFTFNGLGLIKVNCALKMRHLVIEGENHEITIIKKVDTKDERRRTIVGAIAMLFSATMFGELGRSDFLLGNKGIALQYLTLSAVSFSVGVLFIWWAHICSKCRSMWRLNFFHRLYLEYSDATEIESILASFPVQKEPDKIIFYRVAAKAITKTDLVTLPILAIIFLLSLFEVLPHSEKITLLLPGYLIFLNIKIGIVVLENLKW